MPPQRAERPSTEARPRVLVIDADEDLCNLIGIALRSAYAVASVPHGAAALDMVKVHEPALILLDPRSPIMDGWSFVQQYRRLATATAKIVAMSAARDLPLIARQLGADGQLRKPFELQALHQLLDTHLGARGPSTAT